MTRIDYPKNQRLGFFYPGHTDYEKVGSYRGLQIWANSDEECILLEVVIPTPTKNKYVRVMAVDLSRSDLCDNVWEVGTTAVSTAYQGFGLAPKIYRYLMKKTGITLQAGNSQSAGGRSIWHSLSKFEDVLILGKRFRKPLLVLEADEDEKEITTGIDKFEIYDSAGFCAFASYSPA